MQQALKKWEHNKMMFLNETNSNICMYDIFPIQNDLNYEKIF